MSSISNGDLTQLSPLFRARDTGPTLDVLGVTHIYKAMASETGQQFSVWGIDRAARRRRAPAHPYPRG